ncbi:2-polyprenyl-3-methyl-5-hydroxy-6-metoxy-1,4-benzoquinol methylase [Pseudonocardia thermophila]|uniref:2-polyprenyl-3-methyl-5-hydroxy-6-metoxy-1,4-benzoquinol methylase n=1 Tax=Pseudonocardia thermophila TaxID=1848 RepID=A0A1M6SPS5_PSETH|nr:class I SAM-dependent methyltransferase [Pseudonocardia thermophila]SHK46649.1 2-polyprenyl-3-methyl-5-hydroxy-6-metoxy-1,4-benzoquinol methylase [Pseudonocardia thermophila]
MTDEEPDTASAAYTERLVGRSGAGWKRLLDVQAPYRRNLQRLLGDRRTLDVGCGIGRLLRHRAPGSVGVDHNPHSVAMCRRAGLTAYTVEEFLARPPAEPLFEAMLAAHLVEHLPPGEAAGVLKPYLAYLAPRAVVVLICPQERGFASDPTHTVYFDQAALAALAEELGLVVERQYSFPLPRFAGRFFTHNEFVTVARNP